MGTTATEALNDRAIGIDARPLAEAAMLLAEGQIAAARSVQAAEAAIAAAAATMAATLRNGGVLHYVAAGSSGLMAAADAQELGGTFSIPASQLRIHMAGGLPTGVEMPGDTEDDTDSLRSAFRDLSARDAVISVSASGRTPYTLAAAALSRAAGATLIAIANAPDAPLFEQADHAICLETPPELVSGSTRMGAGTAQKIALNMMSTLMAIELGHVHDGMMVNLRADNTKLRQRAATIVTEIAGVSAPDADRALAVSNGAVKPAILVARGGITHQAACAMLAETQGNLRAALARVANP